jgi:hypothetical protein
MLRDRQKGLPQRRRKQATIDPAPIQRDDLGRLPLSLFYLAGFMPLKQAVLPKRGVNEAWQNLFIRPELL